MRVSVHACNAFLLALILSTLSLSAQSLGENWDSRFSLPGVQAIIESTVVGEDGQIYISGSVAWGNGTPEADYFLRWDGERWRDLGIYNDLFTVDGIQMRRYSDRSVQSLALYNGILYAITHDPENYSHSYIIAWDGEKWSLLEGAVFNDWVRTLIVHDSKLYVGGEFSSLSGYPNGEGLVYWDGQAWEQSEAGVGRSFSDFVFNEYGTLYTSTEKWDGQQWVSFGDSATNRGLQSFVVAGTTVYAAYRQWGDQKALQLEGNAWRTISTYLDPKYSLSNGTWKFIATDKFGRAYLTGRINDTKKSYYIVLCWNGNHWEALPHKFSGEVDELFLRDDGSYIVTGKFSTINDSTIVKCIARWDGNSWHTYASKDVLNEGLHGNVTAVEHFDGYLYAGGSDIVVIHPSGVHNILRWSEQTGWEDIAGGVDGAVNVIRPHPDGGLIVAGCFNRAGTVAVKNVAHWDGGAWHSIGNGSDVCINDLSTINDTIYAVGETSLLRWAGAGWEHIHLPINNQDASDKIAARTVVAGKDGSVYVGGRFDSINGLSVNNIARWKNGVWEGLGTGLRMRGNPRFFYVAGKAVVRTLAMDGEYLYAGGTFDSAGIVLAFQIARWDGQSWNAMDSGLVGAYYNGASATSLDLTTIHSIKVVNGAVYVAGLLYGAGSWSNSSPQFIQTSGLVRWDEESNAWNSLLNFGYYDVFDIAFDDNHIYVGTSGAGVAKNKPSYGIARTTFPNQQISMPLCKDELPFEPTIIGRSTEKNLIISNPISSHRTLVGTATVQNGPFSVQGDGTFRVAPGQELKLPITFRPTTPGLVTGQIIIHHNSTVNATPLSVTLSGIGTPIDASWSVEPPLLDFGTQTQWMSRETLSVTITNSLHSNVTLTLEPTQPDTPFFVQRGPHGQHMLEPKTIAQGESLTLQIGFDLSKTGTFTDQLIIRHDGEPNGEIVIPLIGVVSPQFGAINSTPSSINFGMVKVHQTETQPVVITSHPQTNIWASYRVYNYQQRFKHSAGWDRKNLTPGVPDTVWVSFTPDAGGSFADTLTLLKIFDFHTDTLRIPVRGTGIEPVAHIRVSTAFVDFGDVALGNADTASIGISNLPNASAKLALSRNTLAHPFKAEGAEYDTVKPGQSITLTAIFAPESTGQFYSKFHITHNSPDLPNPFEIVLRGSSSLSDVNEMPNNAKAPLQLQVEPNPLSKNGAIRFRIPKAADVVLEVFTLDGRNISHLAKGRYTAGEHRVEWNTNGLASGTYLCRLTAGNKETSITVQVE